MAQIRKNGQTSNTIRIKILNSTVTTGAGVTGLTNASAGLNISTICDNEATATAYTQAGSTIDTIATLGTFAAPTAGHCRFKEVDSTNHPGVYELQIADARFAVSGAKSMIISVSGAPNAAQADVEILLTACDLQDGQRLALASLPNANPAANGGLPTVDASNRVAGVNGNITGSVGSVTGAVASVTATVNANLVSVQGNAFTGSTKPYTTTA